MKYKGMKTLFEDGLRKTEEGLTTIEEIIRVKDLEGCGYLEKPFEPEKLQKLIMEHKACKAS